MLFNSFAFLAFFTLLVPVYYCIPHKHRWGLLVAASLFYYATFNVGHLALLLGVSLVAYVSGLAIEGSTSQAGRRAGLATGTVLALGALVVVKYSAMIADAFGALLHGVGAPPAPSPLTGHGTVAAVGLSFYTFSCIAYLADVYEGRLRAERHAGHFVLYVSFFPKLLAGPVERAAPFLSQLSRHAVFSDERVTAGLQLVLWGLFKKVVVADRLAGFVDLAYRQPQFVSVADLVIATYFFAFQLYCDFSGYSDIAIGTAKILGFDLIENFRRPYFSTSVREFWAHRWHVSLASWFRDYLYIPLGGNRGHRYGRYVRVMAVFMLSGLWHGASWTFVVWGTVNGLYQVLSFATSGIRRRILDRVRLPEPVMSLVRPVLTFHLVLVTWVFFRAATLSDATIILTRVSRSLWILPGLLRPRLADSRIAILLVLLGILLAVEALDEGQSVWERLRARPVYERWAVYYALLLGLVVFGSWQLQQFVYMRF